MRIPFALHRRLPYVRRPFWQRGQVIAERDAAVAGRDTAVVERDAALAERRAPPKADAANANRSAPTEEPEGTRTDPKPLGLLSDNLADLSNEDFDLVAKTVSSVVRRAIPRKFDQRMGALAGGDTDANRFFYVGLEWLEFLIRYGSLPPWGTVLDVGCGTGRMALPLSYITDEGGYYGFDLLQESIDHCKREIEHPAFHFERIDLSHHSYNQHGVIRSDTYDFPYPDEFFDATFAAFVFTHLDVPTASNYLQQICRTLRPGGRAILSFHAIPADALCREEGVTRLLGVDQGEWAYRFRNPGNGYYTHCDEDGAPKNHYLSDPVGDPVAYQIDNSSDCVRTRT